MIPIEHHKSELGTQQRTLGLSREAREVLQLTLEEAATFGRGYYIDTADLLVGLSQVGITGEKLQQVGINPESIREIKRQQGGYDYFNRLQPPVPSTAIERWEQLPRTQRMHKIGRMVTETALLAKRDVVEPEDILEVIIKEGQGTGARVLRQMGIDQRNQKFLGLLR
ncbi:hypothetical protein HYW41_01305 [Candidatus Daviesbacteria bacterium]|nr:hypothetical protein [Candidatus Daviesbacteria bacterium]